MAEGCGNAYELAPRIEELTGVVTRATVLGHVQRGGTPSIRDRVMASQMGIHAANLLLNGVGNRVVALSGGKVTDFDIRQALSVKKPFDVDLLAEALSINI